MSFWRFTAEKWKFACGLGFGGYVFDWFFYSMNLSWIWADHIVEQVHLDVNLILPALQTFLDDAFLTDWLLKSENLHAALDSEVLFSIVFLRNDPFLDLSRPYCRAGPFRRESDTPSSPNLHRWWVLTSYCSKLKICMRPWIGRLGVFARMGSYARLG